MRDPPPWFAVGIMHFSPNSIYGLTLKFNFGLITLNDSAPKAVRLVLVLSGVLKVDLFVACPDFS